MLKKLLIILVYIVIAIGIVVFKDELIDWLKQPHRYDIIWLTIIAVFIGLVPIVPYGLVGGIIGAKYGLYGGGLLNVLSSSLAAIIMFIAIRYLFQQRGRALLKKHKSMDSFTSWMERHPFIAILIGRMLPFVPAVVINCYTAISQVKLSHFITATLIGKIPVMLLFALLGHQALHAPQHMIWTIIMYSLFLCVIIGIYRAIIR